jgi:hypothetical protein
VRVTAREVGPGRAAVGHEQRVADERGVLDLVGDVGRRVARRVDRLRLEVADVEALTVLEQVIEVAAVGLQVRCIEPGRKMRCTSLMCSPMPIFAPVLALI